MITSKYCDHLPLYRQEQMFTRHRVVIARSTMCGWLKEAARLLERKRALNHVFRGLRAGQKMVMAVRKEVRHGQRPQQRFGPEASALAA